MLSVTEAQQAILASVKRLEPETVSLLEALGRVLAEEVRLGYRFAAHLIIRRWMVMPCALLI